MQGDLRGAEVPNTIALVDDDRNILTSVSMALEAEGFSVRCYSDGVGRGATIILELPLPSEDSDGKNLAMVGANL